MYSPCQLLIQAMARTIVVILVQGIFVGPNPNTLESSIYKLSLIIS